MALGNPTSYASIFTPQTLKLVHKQREAITLSDNLNKNHGFLQNSYSVFHICEPPLPPTVSNKQGWWALEKEKGWGGEGRGGERGGAPEPGQG